MVQCPGDGTGPCPRQATWSEHTGRGTPRLRCPLCMKDKKNRLQREFYAYRKAVTGYGNPRKHP